VEQPASNGFSFETRDFRPDRLLRRTFLSGRLPFRRIFWAGKRIRIVDKPESCFSSPAASEFAGQMAEALRVVYEPQNRGPGSAVDRPAPSSSILIKSDPEATDVFLCRHNACDTHAG
jgi:hypothetical protein